MISISLPRKSNSTYVYTVFRTSFPFKVEICSEGRRYTRRGVLNFAGSFVGTDTPAETDDKRFCCRYSAVAESRTPDRAVSSDLRHRGRLKRRLR